MSTIDAIENVEDIEQYVDVDKLTNLHYKCYQIQVIDDVCVPVFIGAYENVPLPIIKVMKYKKYVLHIVVYLMTKEEVDNMLYKIVGINIARQNRANSLWSFDLIYNVGAKCFQHILCDHKNGTVKEIENIEKFPGRDRAVENLVMRIFEDPVNKIFFK
jgi:hypothetical protein